MLCVKFGKSEIFNVEFIWKDHSSQVGNISFIHGDCIEVMQRISDGSVDLVVTSPPYFNIKAYSKWDSYDTYIIWLKNVFEKVYEKLREGRMCCVNISSIIVPREARNKESKRIPLPFHFVNIMGKAKRSVKKS